MISGEELRKEREGAGVSAGAVAREMEVSRQYVSKIEAYEMVTGETLVLARAGIEAALARKEGREPMKQVPLFCPIDEVATESPHAMNLLKHLDAKHREREVVVTSEVTQNPRLGGWISASGGRRGYLVIEGGSTFGVIFADYPYQVMTFPVETYKFEPVGVVATPEEAK